MPTIKRVITYEVGGTQVYRREADYGDTGDLNIVAQPVANGVTDQEIPLAFNFAGVKAILLYSDQDMTIETNNGTTPDDTISLLAGVEYEWTSDSYDTLLVTADVVSLFVTNASGSAALLTARVRFDPSP